MFMKKYYKKFLVIVLILLMLIGGIRFVSYILGDDMPGRVIGNNPNNIKESELPICYAPAGGIVNEPCYSPPDAIYE
jgi:hypothetical protein